MSPIFVFLFLLAAFICFIVAAFGSRFAGKINLIGLGLALFVFVPLYEALVAIG
ncbi:MAG: hypothetical protein ACRDZ4_18555 [Egibacteraceae bacterium]